MSAGGDFYQFEAWDEDPLPVASVAAVDELPEQVVPRRRPVRKPKTPALRRLVWTPATQTQGRRLIEAFARSRCRCNGFSHRCLPCRARAFLKTNGAPL